ncbi:MAG TPA: two-component regulator propeller domain-containing protein [Chitinophagaceae bacterium]|nr:two-component regulator propeller domain-containing protein [Chitinophagaceae bacterium]
MHRIAIVLACFFTWTANAQQYPFVHYTPREGLADNRVRFIFQDSKGKLYISTYGGLSIYDGTRFTNYNTNNGLAASLVNAVVEMGEDSLWIVQNANKIHCLVNGRLKEFIPDDHYTPIINQLVRCSDGNYYALADEGLFRLEGRRFRKIELNWLQKNGDAAGLVTGVELNKKLFILSNPGFLSPYAVNLFVYDFAQNRLLGHKSNITAVSITNIDGREIWLSTAAGVYKIDDASTIRDSIILQPLPASYHLPEKVIPRSVYRDRQHNTWLATQSGVYRIKQDGETTRFTVENGLNTNAQNAIFQDYENNMWFINEETGLSKLPNQLLIYYPEIMKGFHVTDIFVAPYSDSVWLYDGYHRRVLFVEKNKQPVEYFYKGPNPGPSQFVSGYNQFMLRGNSIFHWRADRESRNFNISPFYTEADSSTKWEYLFGLVDKNKNLIALSDKLHVWSGDTKLVAALDYFTDKVAVDGKGRIWAATRGNKLNCFGVSRNKDGKIQLSLLRTYSKELPFMSPRSIIADKAGNMWIGTRDHGLALLHFDDLILQSVQFINTQDGLSNNFVNYLLCDDDNTIWACTPSGLDRIRKGNNRFFVENITRRNNFYFPMSKVQETKSGRLWILSTAGLLTYDPVRQQVNDWKPRLEFTDIVIGNAQQKVLKPGSELRYYQNNLGFQLSAPSFIDEKQTRFSYLLEGSGNEEWSQPSGNATINFVNLPPGEYTLRAKAFFLHGQYPELAASFPFTVLPPWWQTWWFRLIVAILVLALVFLGLRFYINRKLELQRMTLEKKQAIEKERTRIATDMHDDLGAGLSRIKFLSETIGMKKQQHLPIEEEIDHIRTYSHEMIDKMGEIVWALNEKNDTLWDLLSYTRAYAVEYLEQNGIACHVVEPDAIPQRVVSSEFRRNIYLTVKEALHNVVKHAQATDVFISIDIASDRLNIQISDNGKGIDKPGRSAGNGLLNMHARIKELRGQIDFVNRNGTLVDIAVPLDR